MSEPRNPAPGPPSRDPTAAARLLAAASDVSLRVERARNDVEWLAHATGELARTAGVPPAPQTGASGSAPQGPSPAGRRSAEPRPERSAPERARQLAIDLAVGGVPREQIGDELAHHVEGTARPPLAGGAPQDAAEDDAEDDLATVTQAPPDDPGGEGAPETEQERRTGRGGMLGVALQTYGSQVGMGVLSLVNALIVSRALGATGRGEVVFLTAIAFLGSNLWTMGVQEFNVNLAGSEPATRPALATNSLFLSVICGGVGGLLMALLIYLVPAAGAGVSWTLLWLIFASMPMLVLNSYLRFLIQGEYGFGVTNLAWIVPSVMNVGINGTFAIVSTLTVGIAVSTWVAGWGVATALMVWWLIARSGGFGRPNVALAARSLAFGIKSHLGRIMLLANYRVDQWLLGAIGGTRQLGQYSVAVAWAEVLFLLPTSLAAVQRPTIVRASPDDAVRLTAKVFRLALVITSVLAIGLIIAAPFLCVTIFGSEFHDSVADLRVLALGAFGVIALKQLGNTLTGRNHPVAASLSIGSAFLFTVVLDVLLIPLYDDLGAAIASSVAYTAGGIVICVVFVKTLGGRYRDLIPRPSDIREMRTTGRTIMGRLRGSRQVPVDPAAQAPPA